MWWRRTGTSSAGQAQAARSSRGCRRRRPATSPQPCVPCSSRASGLGERRHRIRRPVGSLMDLALAGRVALITGPAKGMGAAITRAFAGEGCRLALLARDVDAVGAVAAELRAAGREIVVIHCDLTDGAACQRAATEACAALGGRIDIL